MGFRLSPEAASTHAVSVGELVHGAFHAGSDCVSGLPVGGLLLGADAELQVVEFSWGKPTFRAPSREVVHWSILKELGRAGMPSPLIAADTLAAMGHLAAEWHKAVMGMDKTYWEQLEPTAVEQFLGVVRHLDDLSVLLLMLPDAVDPHRRERTRR